MDYPISFIPVFSYYPNDKQNDVEFYIAPFSSDCPICFQYQKEPVSLQCGHIYCRECIINCFDVRKRCPVCLSFSNKFKPVKLFFPDNIIVGSFITFRKIKIRNIENYKNYMEHPYSSCYFINGEKNEDGIFEYHEDNRKVVYQEINGNPYFLSLKNIKELRSYPKIIQGNVINIRRRRNYDLFGNLRPEKEIFIVEL